MIEGIQYLNSGDWVETMSALAEDHEGNWQLIYYNEIDFKQKNESVTPLVDIHRELKAVAFNGLLNSDKTPPFRF